MRFKSLQKAKILSVTLLVLFLAPAFCPARPTPEPQRTERTEWWREAKFGMFIHWGLYAVPAGQWKGEVTDEYSEWIMFHNRIPVKEYELIAARFNPVKFNAEEWVKLAKQAGMKYIVITAKHHDGFSMFDSSITTYDIVDATPFARDPMKELSEACHREGIKFGFYYSIDRDWHHPDAQGNDLRQSNTWDYQNESKKDFNKYFEQFAKPQIKELLTQYGPLGIMWFDGIGKKTAEQNEEIIAMVRKYQPDCLINSRLGDWKTYEWGDYRSMDDNQVSNRDLSYGWENPGTINHTYGYNKHDKDWKSATEIIHMLVDIASNGGNYLLNIGPKADGSIPAESVRVLQEVGKWMEKYGESIYGTTPGSIEKPEWGRCTAKDDRLYLHVFEWPTEEKLVVSGIGKKVKKVHLLADPDRNDLEFKCLDSGDVVIELNTISLPANGLDISDTVMVLETDD